MMLKTYLGVIEDESGLHYLRPETAQGIFLNFANVVTLEPPEATLRHRPDGQELPQRDHPRQLHLPHPRVRADGDGFFVKPGEDDEWFRYWIEERTRWYVDLGINPDNLRHYEHPEEKLSHYSKGTTDIEYRFGFSGRDFEELEGIANRTDFDLKQHSEFSGKDLSYYDQAADERYLPYVIEPAAGLTRSLMAFLIDAYTEDEAPNTKGGVDKRVVLKLDPRLAPVKVAVLPLSRNADLSPKAKALAAELRRTGTSTSTTPGPSAVATAARTRSARPTASPSTSRPSRTTPSPSATATRWRRSGSASWHHALVPRLRLPLR